jgi:hypothetical protein
VVLTRFVFRRNAETSYPLLRYMALMGFRFEAKIESGFKWPIVAAKIKK